MDPTLEKLRKDIDRIDSEIIPLLNRRAELALEIGHIKHSRGEPLYVPERERSVIDRLLALNRGPMPHQAIMRIYREIMTAALSLEQQTLVLTGGGQNSTLLLAVEHIAGNKAQVRHFNAPEELVQALIASPAGTIAIVTGAWQDALSKMVSPSTDSIAWRGCWRLKGPDAPEPLLCQLFQKSDPSREVGRPASISCLIEPDRFIKAAPDWIADVPLRSTKLVPVQTPEGKRAILTVDLEASTKEITECWLDAIRSHAEAVWFS